MHDVIFDFEPAKAAKACAVLDHCIEGAEEDRGPYGTEDHAARLREEFSTFRWLLEPMLAAAGFDIVASEFRERVYGIYTCVKR